MGQYFLTDMFLAKLGLSSKGVILTMLASCR
jgi:hypothetical protein